MLSNLHNERSTEDKLDHIKNFAASLIFSVASVLFSLFIVIIFSLKGLEHISKNILVSGCLTIIFSLICIFEGYKFFNEKNIKKASEYSNFQSLFFILNALSFLSTFYNLFH